MDELDTCHKEQQKNMSSEIKEEMALFQKKILMETVSYVIIMITRGIKVVTFCRDQLKNIPIRTTRFRLI